MREEEVQWVCVAQTEAPSKFHANVGQVNIRFAVTFVTNKTNTIFSRCVFAEFCFPHYRAKLPDLPPRNPFFSLNNAQLITKRMKGLHKFLEEWVTVWLINTWSLTVKFNPATKTEQNRWITSFHKLPPRLFSHKQSSLQSSAVPVAHRPCSPGSSRILCCCPIAACTSSCRRSSACPRWRRVLRVGATTPWPRRSRAAASDASTPSTICRGASARPVTVPQTSIMTFLPFSTPKWLI